MRFVRRSALLVPLLMTTLQACGASRRLPATLGERSSGHGYVPLDGLGVIQGYDQYTCHQDGDRKKPRIAEWRPLLDALPDVNVRFAVASVDASGGLAFGPAKITSEGQLYRVVLDYVNVDAVSVPFYARKAVRKKSGGAVSNRGILARVESDEEVLGYEARLSYASPDSAEPKKWIEEGFDPLTVPVYVGIGIRLSADVRALKGGVSLSSLAGIGAEAQANSLTGTMTVQSLGVTGPAVATALPLPSRLDQTTVENGILALGSGRASIFGDSANTTKTARIVGLYSPVEPDSRLINQLYSLLASRLPSWFRPCGAPKR